MITAHRRRGTALLAALVGTALALTACSGSPEDTPTDNAGTASETRSFEADNGTIEIPVDPQRIVALGSAGTYLNLGVEPVGMPRASESELPWLSSEEKQINEAAVDTGDEVDYEQLAGLTPDLIVVFDPARAWEGDQYDEERLQSIAPTVYIELNVNSWKTQVGRLADAVGELDDFDASEAAYDTLTADIKDEYAGLLDSTTFIVLNRFASTEDGVFVLEHPGGYCPGPLEDAGLKILPENAEDVFAFVSMEQLSDTVADADVIIYPLGADGNVMPAFAPVLESNIWQSLPQVQGGQALGVQCNSFVVSYSSNIPNLESLKEALATLPEAG
ncbi:ABC transporter substrate-binding protein [Microbacterium sp. JB110]|uniref:ABC transporter substrate-binding protein n=1 Tax=Microbacterium sp. JB110 TaxID=2024477 RepID=UPI00097F5118|nr:ABC transporter substrate-binding protein [Microbacterium sp. JB110]RCS61182.1 ABC transporter substrate-binding protein [Microbacterium sp. JB110]SJM69499.1 Ferrichrome-binding periplasmic protein precursor (TC 3.A.1.14.3) [Frigoribacterium sp. JB110]